MRTKHKGLETSNSPQYTKRLYGWQITCAKLAPSELAVFIKHMDVSHKMVKTLESISI